MAMILGASFVTVICIIGIIYCGCHLKDDALNCTFGILGLLIFIVIVICGALSTI